jgi:hypothetical protein
MTTEEVLDPLVSTFRIKNLNSRCLVNEVEKECREKDACCFGLRHFRVSLQNPRTPMRADGQRSGQTTTPHSRPSNEIPFTTLDDPPCRVPSPPVSPLPCASPPFLPRLRPLSSTSLLPPSKFCLPIKSSTPWQQLALEQEICNDKNPLDQFSRSRAF